VRDVLAAVYPTIRWNVVSFHVGIPAAARVFTQGAITLPALLGTRAIRIHVSERRWAPLTVSGLALLVHECFHVLQFQERFGGLGLGPLRGFAVQYLLRASFEGGGEANLYEAPAYAHERAFAAACRALPRPLCASEGTIDREMLDLLLRRNPALVRRSSR
jgi:hypothetical protein